MSPSLVTVTGHHWKTLLLGNWVLLQLSVRPAMARKIEECSTPHAQQTAQWLPHPHPLETSTSPGASVRSPPKTVVRALDLYTIRGGY